MQCSAMTAADGGARPAAIRAGLLQHSILKEGCVEGAPATTQFHQARSPCTAQMNALLRIGDDMRDRHL